MKKLILGTLFLLFTISVFPFEIPEKLAQTGITADLISNTLICSASLNYTIKEFLQPKWDKTCEYTVISMEAKHAAANSQPYSDDICSNNFAYWIFLKKSAGKWSVERTDIMFGYNNGSYLAESTGSARDDVVLEAFAGNHGGYFMIISFIEGQFKITFNGEATDGNFHTSKGGFYIGKYALIDTCNSSQVFRQVEYRWNGSEFVKQPDKLLETKNEYYEIVLSTKDKAEKKAELKILMGKFDTILKETPDDFLVAYNAATVAYKDLKDNTLGRSYYKFLKRSVKKVDLKNYFGDSDKYDNLLQEIKDGNPWENGTK